MIYAALGILVTLLVGASAVFAAGYKVGAAGKARAEAERDDALARAASAESRATAAQPDAYLDALSLDPTDDELLLDAVFGPPDSPGWSASVESPSRPDSLGADTAGDSNAE